MTSNIGAKLISNNRAAMGFVDEADEHRKYSRMKSLVTDEVKRFFKPEFVNRIDEMIVFNSLSEDDVKEITRRMLSQVSLRCREAGIEIIFSESVVDEISKVGINSVYGARPLRRAVTTHIEDFLTEKFLSGKLKPGGKCTVDFQDNEFVFKC